MSNYLKQNHYLLLTLVLCILSLSCSKEVDVFEELTEFEDSEGIENPFGDENSDELDATEESSNNDETFEADFVYSNFTAAFEDASLWFDEAKIQIQDLQGGNFTYFASLEENSDGGLVFDVPNRSGKLTRIWNNDGIVKAEWFGIIPNDSSIDNKGSFERMLSGKRNNTNRFSEVQFEGTYNFDETVNLPTLSNLTFRSVGSEKAEFTSDNLYIIFTTGFTEKWTNFSMYGIKTSSSMNDRLNESIGNSATLWAFGEGGGENHYYEDCEFTAPNVYTNGMKYYGDTTDDYNNITFKNCYFHDCGRFAIEIFGVRIPNYNPELAAIKNVTFDGGRVERTGTMGQLGISIVQSIQNVTIKNMVLGDNNSSLELGANNVKVHNNEFFGDDNAMSFGGIYDDLDNPMYLQTDYEIYENTGEVSGGLSFIAVENLNFHDNDWTFNTSFYFNNVRNVSFISDIIRIRGYTNWGGGTVIPTMQFFNTVENIRLEKSYYEYLNTSTFSSNSSIMSLVNSEVHIQSQSSFTINSAQTLRDVSVYLNGSLVNILNK